MNYSPGHGIANSLALRSQRLCDLDHTCVAVQAADLARVIYRLRLPLRKLPALFLVISVTCLGDDRGKVLQVTIVLHTRWRDRDSFERP